MLRKLIILDILDTFVKEVEKVVIFVIFVKMGSFDVLENSCTLSRSVSGKWSKTVILKGSISGVQKCHCFSRNVRISKTGG